MQQTKRRILMATLAAFTLTAAVPAFAQGGGRGGMRGGGPGGNRVNFLAGYLGLSDAQKTQAQAIFDSSAAASTTAQGQLTSAREALQTAVKANAAEGELDRLAAAMGVIEGQLAGIRAKSEAKFHALLTPDQKTKFDSAAGKQRGPRPTGRPNLSQ